MTVDSKAPALVDSDFVAMMNASDTCTLLHDARTKEILWANPAARAMLGFSLGELVSLRANHISGAAQQYDRVVARALLQDAIDHGAGRVEWHLRAKSSQVIPTDAFAVRVELARGPAVMVQYRDIERERRTDTEQRLAESYVETLTRHTSTVAFMLDATGVVVSATDTALGYLHLTGQHTSPVRHELTSFAAICLGASPASWEDVARGTEPIQPVRLEIDRPGGQPVWLEGSVERLPQQEADVYLMILHDVSDRVRDEALRELEQRRENHVARYNAMGDMAMAIAHELGQPLAAAGNFLAGVRARVDAAPAGGDLDRQLRYGLDGASRQIDRAAAIVSTLRAFVGHLEHVEQVVDLNDIVRECLPFIRLRAEPVGVRLDLDLSAEPVRVRCERVLTGQVVLNLCFNAIDEMAECHASARHVLLTTDRRTDQGVLTVADRGRGLRRDPFSESFTGKAHGSGIGLALSHRIVTRQHGRIWSEPRPGDGSVFGFALPLAEPV
ncbi:PAS domain-containing sensor histidine kinase [Streptomyces sp. NPDC046821]|uniref:PAS domain-containing sensor histidine kinase n=1 Tax=Streptomyces sp. NPDC046821 TaxID=3154702 RepID=UPI0033FF0DD2